MISGPDLTDQRRLRENFEKFQAAVSAGDLSMDIEKPEDGKIFAFLEEHFATSKELPDFGRAKEHFGIVEDGDNPTEGDTLLAERLKDILAAEPFVQTNFSYLLKQLTANQKRHRTIGLLRDQAEALKNGKTSVKDVFARVAEKAPVFARELGFTKASADDPLHGTTYLQKIAVVGYAQIQELADRPVVWIWDHVATAGLIVVLAAGVGSGKTTLLFQLIVARVNAETPISVLGHTVQPIPKGRFAIVVENEHSDESAARILMRSCAALEINPVTALERVILIARGDVRLGSPAWAEIVTLIEAGLVGDIYLDTLARCAPSDANDEKEQVEIFASIANAIQKAPTPDARPTVWIAAHTRKGDNMPTLNDVSGSAQRTAQGDVVVGMLAERTDGIVTAVKINFLKTRETDPDNAPRAVTYVVRGGKIVITDGEKQNTNQKDSLADQIVSLLQVHGELTKNAIRTRTGRNLDDIETAITELFATERIAKTTITIRGKSYPGFRSRVPATANDVALGPDGEYTNGAAVEEMMNNI